MTATWDEIRARSESKMGTNVFCGDCWMAWQHAQLPCRKHATPDELVRIDDHVEQALSRLALEPPPWMPRSRR